MIKRAIWISVVFHLLILLTLSRFIVESGSPEVKGRLVSQLSAPGHHVQPKKEQGTEFTKIGPPAANRSVEAARMPDKKPKNQVREDSDFGRFFPSTVRAPQTVPQGASAQSIETPTEAETIPVETLGLFRLNLAKNARPYKAYPTIARENGWEGVAVISVIYPLGQGAPVTALERSSGHVILDRQALEMIERALPATMLPAAMRGKHFAVSLPIEYRIHE